MHTNLVMTIMGPDHPGLVEAVAAVISRHDGNWLESRMARLAGQFAGLLRVSVPTARGAELRAALEALQQRGLTVVIAETSDDRASTTRAARLDLTGHDHPGIVHRVSEVIAAQGGNIIEWSTAVTPTPMSGAPMFTATGLIELSQAEDAPRLQKALEALAADLMVDLTLADPSA